MKYSILLTGNTFNEYSLFLGSIKEYKEYEISLEDFGFYTGRYKWEALLGQFSNLRGTILTEFSLINLEIVVQKGFLGVLEDNKIRILINETNQNVYIDKYFERDYKKLFLKFKEILLSLYATSKDIIYTDNPGKCCFYQFEKPKFKSISERKEYVNSLLDTLNE